MKYLQSGQHVWLYPFRGDFDIRCHNFRLSFLYRSSQHGVLVKCWESASSRNVDVLSVVAVHDVASIEWWSIEQFADLLRRRFIVIPHEMDAAKSEMRDHNLLQTNCSPSTLQHEHGRMNHSELRPTAGAYASA